MVDSEVRNMTKWLMAAGIILLGGALVVPDAEARRIGGGRSIGTQRNVTAPPAQTAAKPAQQAAPAQQGSRWLPILGGLALGGMLGYLFGGSGVFGFLLLALLAIGAVFAVRALMRRRAEASQPMQYAGMRETVHVTPGGTASPVPAEKTRVPAGFDAAGFLRGAKMNFLRLQAANDAGRLDEVRELTTTELYEELKRDPNGRSSTEVNGLEAQLLEVVTEGDQHWASVRFSGTVRESPDAAPESFAEVWNLVKPADGSTGWLLAGIQQMR
jgi:predicted lipid-binding transport protein (Tim44 family)